MDSTIITTFYISYFLITDLCGWDTAHSTFVFISQLQLANGSEQILENMAIDIQNKPEKILEWKTSN